jgi:nucleolar protein 56
LFHSYSSAKVKFDGNKSDNMIVQSIVLLDQLDKDIDTFYIRIRERYSYHFPELIKIVPENAFYDEVVKLMKNAQDMLEEIVMILMYSARAA